MYNELQSCDTMHWNAHGLLALVWTKSWYGFAHCIVLCTSGVWWFIALQYGQVAPSTGVDLWIKKLYIVLRIASQGITMHCGQLALVWCGLVHCIALWTSGAVQWWTQRPVAPTCLDLYALALFEAAQSS